MKKDYPELTPEEKNTDLYLRQKRTIDIFIERYAISKVNTKLSWQTNKTRYITTKTKYQLYYE